MNEFGQIVELKDGNAVVMIKRSSACAKCGACELGSSENAEMLLTIPNKLNGEVGDYVELELASSQVLKASMISYLIPLFALVLGVIIGYALAPMLGLDTELIGALLGLGLTAVAFLGIRAIEPVINKKHTFSPRMVNIIKYTMKGENDNGK